jgi:hypothetical protein
LVPDGVRNPAATKAKGKRHDHEAEADLVRDAWRRAEAAAAL